MHAFNRVTKPLQQLQQRANHGIRYEIGELPRVQEYLQHIFDLLSIHRAGRLIV
ncbi:hypothetical protein D3C80_2062800 [compost metagenome]